MTVAEILRVKRTQKVRKVSVEAGNDEPDEICVKVSQSCPGHVKQHHDLLPRVPAMLKVNEIGHKILHNRHDSRIASIFSDAKKYCKQNKNILVHVTHSIIFKCKFKEDIQKISQNFLCRFNYSTLYLRSTITAIIRLESNRKCLYLKCV